MLNRFLVMPGVIGLVHLILFQVFSIPVLNNQVPSFNFPHGGAPLSSQNEIEHLSLTMSLEY
jgi:hypothetical protein